MAYKNSVILGGYLTKDPEVRTTRGGTKVTELGLAVTWPRAQASQGKDNATDYFTVACLRQARRSRSRAQEERLRGRR